MFLSILTVLRVALPLLAATASALNKAGLAAEATAVNDAIAKLQSVHDSEVTRPQLESLRLDPDDWSVIPPAPPAQPGS